MAEGFLRWSYESRSGPLLFRLLNNRYVCGLYQRYQGLSGSRRRIAPFIARYGIDPTEIERPLDEYASFNAFFCRRLKEGARPFPAEPGRLGSPGDGKLLVQPELSGDLELPVKGVRAPLDRLVGSPEEAARYRGGAAAVLRLAPYDYHRFHFCDGGDAGEPRVIGGGYHSVNPIALARVPDVFARNKRAVSAVDSDAFGRVLYIEVGAFNVASIVQSYDAGRVARGQEKGYFQFGGSTIVLLFEPGRVRFDGDLVRDSEEGLEVQVRTGSGIAHAL
jgi:phosphatidylserine decarboxylase